MKRKTQLGIAAFALTLIMLGAMYGFVAVDLSTDRYLAGSLGPMFRVSAMDNTGVSLDLLGNAYTIESAQLDGIRETIWKYRGLLPRSITMTGNATVQTYRLAYEYYEANRPQDEYW